MAMYSIDQIALFEACKGLGIDVETLPRSLREPGALAVELVAPRELPLTLSDAEWVAMEPHIPREPSQADTLGNRAFVDAVLLTIVKGKGWTHLGQVSHEAVRRKFGRWANDGIWQALSRAFDSSEMSSERRSQFQRIAERAERQRRKALARRRIDRGSG